MSMVDVFGQRVSQLGVGVLDRAVQESADAWNRIAETTLGILAEKTTNAKFRHLLPGASTLQPLDEFGIPLPIKPLGSFDVALPFQQAGTAWGNDRISRELMTVGEASRMTSEMLRADGDWLRRHALAALFDDVSWNFSDPLLGTLAILPLANGDTQTYVTSSGIVATDNHYLGQAAAIADATNPFPTIRTELLEHPSNAGRQVVAYVPTANVAAVQALADFVPVNDPLINVAGSIATLAGSIDRGLGDEVLGRVDRVWIIEWAALPTDYILATVDGVPPLMMRELPAPALQGLFRENHSPDGNRLEMRWLRIAGFGVVNRISAVIQHVSDATYDIPTGYDAPLSV